MHAFQWQDSFLQEQEPAIAEQTKKNFRTVTRKKKGLAGFFDAKETIHTDSTSFPE